MGTVLYSMSGDGRGHATRVKTIVDMFRLEHRFVLLAPNHAYSLLSHAFSGDKQVEVRRIPGASFGYVGKRVNYAWCLTKNIPYALKSGSWIKQIRGWIRELKCDFAITDFEPLLPRAAWAEDLPLVAIDHQHLLSVSDFRQFPLSLRCKIGFIATILPVYFTCQQRTLVSSFFHPPLKTNQSKVDQIGVLLRQSVIDATVQRGDHVLVYTRRALPNTLVKSLRKLQVPAIVYGTDRAGLEHGVWYKRIGEHDFVNDLASCRALISSAGNQLLGEAMFLGKPILAFPEPGNFEQMVNGQLLTLSGAGECIDAGAIDSARLRTFLDREAEWLNNPSRQNVSGNEACRRIVAELLSGLPPSIQEPLPKDTFQLLPPTNERVVPEPSYRGHIAIAARSVSEPSVNRPHRPK